MTATNMCSNFGGKWSRPPLTIQITLCDLDVGACIYKKNVPLETFNISLESKAHKICNNMVLNYLHGGKGEKLW